MSRLALPVLGLVSGCASIFDLDPIGKVPDAGAELDAQDAQDAPTGCYGGNGPNADFPPTCINPADTDAWSPPLTTLDTDSTTDCEVALGQVGGAQICLIVAETITLSTRLQVRGGRPLALLATRTLTIGTGGEVLVDSVTNGRRGPNGNPANQNCNAKNGTGVALVGGGGGGGGSFGSIGGGGGNGQLPDGPAGGAGSVQIPPIALRGGCAGGNGGNNGNSGGDGGGAVYLIAGIEIILDGAIINASGAGGLRGNAKSGGGGGGAGGMIMLDAPVITMTSSRLVAHGGGGGGGGGDVAGGDGSHADLTVANYPAPGGPGAVGGGAGGNGAAVGTAANGGTSGTFGGGGGGGGHGVIRLFTTSPTNTATTVSPGPS